MRAACLDAGCAHLDINGHLNLIQGKPLPAIDRGERMKV
jgi:hypothetical protein